MTEDPATDFGAVILTGGTAARLDGADKAGLEVGGTTLLEHALGAAAGASEVVVVGPDVPTSRPVTFVREDPPGGGPAAGLLAGLAGFARSPAVVAVLAVDMPRVTSATFARLRAALDGDDEAAGAVLVDAGGRRQTLCAAYRARALRAAAPPAGEHHGLPLHRLLAPLRLREVRAVGDEARDVDSWADLRALRES